MTTTPIQFSKKSKNVVFPDGCDPPELSKKPESVICLDGRETLDFFENLNLTFFCMGATPPNILKIPDSLLFWIALKISNVLFFWMAAAPS